MALARITDKRKETPMNILVLNAGSSSQKIRLYDVHEPLPCCQLIAHPVGRSTLRLIYQDVPQIVPMPRSSPRDVM